MRLLLRIYFTFCKVSAVTFGGGYAMMPILQREIAEGTGWASSEEILDFYAVSQALPGIISVNVAAFLGHKVRGAWGAIAAVCGVLTPCILIITAIAACLNRFTEYPTVQHALAGISIGVSALILKTVADLWKKSIKDAFGLLLCLLVFLGTLLLEVTPVLYVLAAATLGILWGQRRRKE